MLCVCKDKTKKEPSPILKKKADLLIYSLSISFFFYFLCVNNKKLAKALKKLLYNFLRAVNSPYLVR